MKPIVLVAPKYSSRIDPDDPKERRGEMAKTTFAKAHELIAAHPEIKLVLFSLWTPATARDLEPTIDDVQTAFIANDTGLMPDEMKEFLERLIPALLKLRVQLDEDDSVLYDGAPKN